MNLTKLIRLAKKVAPVVKAIVKAVKKDRAP